jgi:hypothetical protein
MAGFMVVSVAACGPSSTGSAASPSASSSAASPSAAATTTPTPTGSIAACSVLTSQDASQLAGVTFAAGTEGGVTGGVRCMYKTGNAVVLFVFFLLPKEPGLQKRVKLQLQKAGYKQIELPGADSAYEFFHSAGFRLSVIDVVRRDLLLSIEVHGVATTDAKLRAAATTVLGRLP